VRSASGIPCALLISRVTDEAKLGQIVPREYEAMTSHRHCECSEAIQNVSAAAVWIASSLRFSQ